MTCERCGAVSDPNALACPFCKAPTPAAHHARMRREQHEAAEAQRLAAVQAHQEVAARARLEGTSRQALLWSIGSIVLCCLPLGVVGVVQGFRARKLAASLRTSTPAVATFGLVLGFSSLLASASMYTWAIIDSAQRSSDAQVRIDALDKQVAEKAKERVLTQETACLLAELYALKNGHESHAGYALYQFECVGKLTATSGDSADLETFRFRWSSKAYDTHACLKRGTQWYVQSIQKEACAR